MIRSFIAINFPEEIISEILAIQAQLKRSQSSVRWVEGKNLHLTLKFLGEISEEQVETVKVAMGATLERISPFFIELGGVGAFPNLKRPRIIWVGIHDPSDQLSLLYRRLEERLDQIGFVPEEKRFTPHLTLGRVRDARNVESLEGLIHSLREAEVGRAKISHIYLMKSLLTPQGSLYSSLASFELHHDG
ncbi:MAG: RNA 2',3'-cyclic phosphodiesterase [Candidatus Tectomicrobia bacterium]|nr:RNA 2',3'-cyclic phosphodiesterase [Candidatus Tectomicrobia bacterium]